MTYETVFEEQQTPRLEGVCRICASRYSLNPRNKWIGDAIKSIEKEMRGLKPKQRAIVDRIIQTLQEMVIE